MTTQRTNRQVLLRRTPNGPLTPDDVEIVEAPVDECGEGQILVRRVWSTMETAVGSGHADEDASTAVGGPVRSGGLDRVIESRHPDFEPGMWAGGVRVWEQWSLLDGDSRTSRWPRNIDALFQIAVLNGPGPTAYLGLTELGRMSTGDCVLVSDAAGATGSLAVQVAVNLGAEVIGVADTEEKCRWVAELGAETCVNTTTEDLDARLRALRRRGVDVVFDSAGGQVLDIAMRRIADGARIILCAPEPPLALEPTGPTSYSNLIRRGATMIGLKALDMVGHYPQAQRVLRRWHDEGRLDYRVDVAEGLESSVDHLKKALAGDGLGKPLVRICEDPGPGPYEA